MWFLKIKWHNSSQWKPKLSKVFSSFFFSFFEQWIYSWKLLWVVSLFKGSPQQVGWTWWSSWCKRICLIVRWAWKPPHCIIMTFWKSMCGCMWVKNWAWTHCLGCMGSYDMCPTTRLSHHPYYNLRKFKIYPGLLQSYNMTKKLIWL